jgi:hypothetical protein
VRTAAETFAVNPGVDVAKVISTLGVGEALVSTLQENAVPLPVERALICPPRCRMGAITPEERAAVRARSPVGGKYDTRVNRESAYEILSKRAAGARDAAVQPLRQQTSSSFTTGGRAVRSRRRRWPGARRHAVGRRAVRAWSGDGQAGRAHRRQPGHRQICTASSAASSADRAGGERGRYSAPAPRHHSALQVITCRNPAAVTSAGVDPRTVAAATTTGLSFHDSISPGAPNSRAGSAAHRRCAQLAALSLADVENQGLRVGGQVPRFARLQVVRWPRMVLGRRARPVVLSPGCATARADRQGQRRGGEKCLTWFPPAPCYVLT